MINFSEVRLRSNPRFRLVAFDRLDALEHPAFQSLSAEPDFYGLLVPPEGSILPVKSVSHDAALLFLTLREPSCVPHLLTNLFGTNKEDRLCELILDGVFEIEHSGTFVSGPAAFPFLGGRVGNAASSRVAQLSLDAIEYAVALGGLTPSEVATRLYMYNRAPSTPRLQQQFADDSRLRAYLMDGTGVADQLESHWVCEVSQESWLVWATTEPEPRHNFKLYISPTIEDLPQAFRLAVETFVQVKCTRFKIGRTAFGLLRPDKLVAYFNTLEQLQKTAELIRASGAGIAAQGVPFTAAIDPPGLVSWGMDPPRFDQVLAWQEHQSWRQWVAERVAAYTLAAKEAGVDHIQEFVLHRVGLDGINSTTWTPNLAIWRGRGTTEEEVA